MKNFLNNVIIKKVLIVFITIIMISNFIMPNYVCAADGEGAGEKLVEGFFYLIAYVGDAGIKLMQDAMMGTEDIRDGDGYNIKYSPGIIFSNLVPALDINFLGSDDKTVNYQIYDEFNQEDLQSAFDILDSLTLSDFGTDPIETYTKFTQAVPENVKEQYGYEEEAALYFQNYMNDESGALKKFDRVQHLVHATDVSGEKVLRFWIYGGKLYKLEFVDLMRNK